MLTKYTSRTAPLFVCPWSLVLGLPSLTLGHWSFVCGPFRLVFCCWSFVIGLWPLLVALWSLFSCLVLICLPKGHCHPPRAPTYEKCCLGLCPPAFSILHVALCLLFFSASGLLRVALGLWSSVFVLLSCAHLSSERPLPPAARTHL